MPYCLYKLTPLLIAFTILTGCVNQQNVPLKSDFWNQRAQKVVVVNNQKITPALYQEGQEGLLDIAINSVMTDKFSQHLKSSNMNWYRSLRNDFALTLKNHHIKNSLAKDINIVALPNYRNKSDKTKVYANKDYTVLSAKLPGDKLLAIQVAQFGAIRAYYGFIPLGPPRAIVSLQGRLVNLHTNELLWRNTTRVLLGVEGKWDQPPNYSNFDRTLKNALNTASHQLLNDFKENA